MTGPAGNSEFVYPIEGIGKQNSLLSLGSQALFAIHTVIHVLTKMTP